MKTLHAVNTIETTIIAILQSYLTVVAITCVPMFHTYLSVPCQACALAFFPSGSLSLASSQFSFLPTFFNLKTETRISESYENTVVKIT